MMTDAADKAIIEKIPCVAVILHNPAGQVFLQQRDQKPGLGDAGLWTLWGGRVEAGETPDEAIHRELHEELELSGLSLALWRRYLWHWRDGIWVDQYIYQGDFNTPASQLTQHEGQAMGYFSWGEIRELPVSFNFKDALAEFFAEQGG